MPLKGRREMSELFEFLKKRPPGCVKAFRATASAPTDVMLDGHASSSNNASDTGIPIEGADHLRVFFSLDCMCGGVCYSVHGFRWQADGKYDKPLFLAPLFLECRGCGQTKLVFDSDIHGADAENGVRTHRRGEGQRGTYKCSCGFAIFRIQTSFEYGEDLFDQNCLECMGREQDLFTWFDLVGVCERCRQVCPIASFECS